MNKILLLLAGLVLSILVSAQTDLFFSEYIEGSGNDKALEIYNPTKNSIDLSNYFVARFSNGEGVYTSGGITRLSGTLEPYKTFVLVNGQTTSTESSPACSPALQAMANQLDIPYPSPTHMNGNDAMALLKSEDGSEANALPVDLIGQIGLGAKIKSEEGWAPYTDTVITYSIGDVEYQHTVSDYIIRKKDDSGKAGNGPYWLAWTRDHTLRRKYEVFEGVKENPAQFNVSLQWDTVSVAVEEVDKVTGETYTTRKYKDIWDGLGKHDCIVTDPDFKNSVKNFQSASVNVFPTLVQNQAITIQSVELINNVVVYNLKGGEVLTRQFEPSNQVELTLPGLNKGVYFVKTTTVEQTQRVIKIVIQ